MKTIQGSALGLLLWSRALFAQAPAAEPPPVEPPPGGVAPAPVEPAATPANPPPSTTTADAIAPTPPPVAPTVSTEPAPAPGTGLAEPEKYPAAIGPLKVEGKNASIKFGFLMQPQFESIGSASLDGMTNNLFIRRTRLLIGGTIFNNFDFFFDTDFSDLFKTGAAGDGTKNINGFNIQDAFATLKFKAAADALKIDIGYMLPPGSHNALQSAATLLSLDYFSNSFLHNTAFNTTTNAAGMQTPVGNPVGRDVGLQARGLVLDNHLEYRVGLFEGRRNPGSATEVQGQNMFRVAARVQLNLFDPEPGFFYGGTYLGAKQILSVGGAYDFQDDYKHAAADVFFDQPLGPGALTAQVDLNYWDGGDFLPFTKRTAFSAEAGYLISDLRLTPAARFERLWVTGANPDAHESRVSGGLAFFAYGHNLNLKAFYTRIIPDPVGDAYNQFNLQLQYYVF